MPLRETFVMAWRNIWRNPRRTAITSSAIGLGLAGMLVWLGFAEGMNRHMVQAATGAWLGHAQVHGQGFRKTRDLEIRIPDGAALLARVGTAAHVTAAAPRVYATGLLAIGDRSASVQAVGVDLAREPRVTDWKRRLIAGRWPAEPKDAVIGRKLADRLEVEPGARLVLTVSDAATGDLAHRLLHLSGVVASSNALLDGRAVVLSLPALQEVLGLKDELHEVALSLDVPTGELATMEPVLSPLRSAGLEVTPWQELAPAVAQMVEFQDVYIAVTTLMIFFIIGLGVLNTLQMSLLERTREFGILGALGTSPRRLAELILAEAASLGVVGSILGLCVGLVAHWPFAVYGITFTGVEMAGVSFDTALKSELQPLPWAVMTCSFVLLTTLTASWTALRAARLRPVDALRSD